MVNCVSLSSPPLSLCAKKEGSRTECAAQTWQRDLEGRVTFFSFAIHAGQPRLHAACNATNLIMSKVINFSSVPVSCLHFTSSFQACLICILSSKFDYFCPLRPFILSPTSTFVLKKILWGSNNPSSFFSADLSNKQPTTQPP